MESVSIVVCTCTCLFFSLFFVFLKMKEFLLLFWLGGDWDSLKIIISLWMAGAFFFFFLFFLTNKNN